MVKGHPNYVWFNGEIVPWGSAQVHIRTECAMRGANVFEGIRAYWNDKQQELYFFRFEDHLNRLDRSMKIMRMSIPYSHDDLQTASIELMKRNGFREDVHMRPMVYFGEGSLSAYGPDEIFIGTAIVGVPLPSILNLEKGIACCISTWVRISDESIPPRIKAGSNYQNSRLAAVEARINRYDNAILLNSRGKVSEATNACLFIIRDGIPITPPVTDSILESITRATLIELFRQELGCMVLEREVDRTELYVAEEIFLCGSGAEVLPVGSIDRYPVGDGSVGPVTRKIRQIYTDLVAGRNSRYSNWVLPVYRGDPR